jgi:uncharacterized protein with GYD domain
MPTYISLLTFTQKGAETIKDGPKRLDSARHSFKNAGAEIKLGTCSWANTMPSRSLTPQVMRSSPG